MKYFYTYEVDSRFWLYDRYSNTINEVDFLTCKIFETYDKHKFDEKIVLSVLESFANPSKIKKALQEIKFYQEEKEMFVCKNIDKCVMPISEQELLYKYNNEISHVIFNITDNCNMRCKYCKFGETYQDSRNHNNKSMSLEVIDNGLKLIDKYYKNTKTLIIAFYGGEPLIEFNKIKLIVNRIKAKYNNVRFSFTTNGVLLNNKIIDFLIKNNFIIKVSLDGSKEKHDSNRVLINNKGTFDIIKQKLDIIKEKDVDYFNKNMGFILTLAPPYNLMEIVDFFEQNTNINQPILINYVDVFDTTYFKNFNMKNEVENLKEQQKILLAEYIKYKINNIKNKRAKILEEFFSKPLNLLDERLIFPLKYKEVSPNGACYPGIDRLFINTDGKLGMCEKVNENLPLGDVFQGINIDKVKKIYNNYCDIINKVCLDCWAYRLCGSCYNGSIKGGLLSVERKKEDCTIKMKSIKKNLILYTKIKMYNDDAFKSYNLT